MKIKLLIAIVSINDANGAGKGKSCSKEGEEDKTPGMDVITIELL